ncbi:MAG: prolipoprotein diacylglyceryl transferase [Clostridium sp.]|nr:prolipoprotein diacylglyceryl transferase [Clostridiaceae bacterium]MDY5484579.1 prolipoprotein diacylglyceryl transferase [Clostridium sp.]
MKNDLFTIGSLTIHGYGLMIGLGIIAAYLLCEYRANRKGLDSDPLISIALWGVGGGLICAKLLYYITTFDEILEDPSRLLDLGDGFVVYGGIIGGIFGGWLYTRIKKLPFWKYFDLVMPAVALAQGFGRIGCFLAGCCYGLQMESPISIVFTHSDFAPNGVPLLPTQLISSGLDFLHCLILLYAAKKCKYDGQVSALYLIFYSIGRFGLEYLRGDLIRGSVGALSTSQFISIFILAIGIALFVLIPKFEKNGKKIS